VAVTDLLSDVLVPIANEEVAEQTAVMAREYLRDDSEARVLHVVQDEDAFADASDEEWEAFAEEAFDAFREGFGREVTTELRHGTDVTDTIVATAEDVGASAVLFVPRGGSRWRQLMSGDVARELVSESTVPVVALPRPDEDA
jgi:nucleotide-binding universal stress UspA family protein